MQDRDCNPQIYNEAVRRISDGIGLAHHSRALIQWKEGPAVSCERQPIPNVNIVLELRADKKEGKRGILAKIACYYQG